ncbi:MAG: hypothetical protein CL732_05845 [Chloroflexi bacterium]|nr:hypothetical protein [Chloroflexota bacterium]
MRNRRYAGYQTTQLHIRSTNLELFIAFLLALGAYVLGSVPTGYILVRLANGQDIREHGTGNVGAMNAFRQAGPTVGQVTLLLDAGKGAAAVFVPFVFGLDEWAHFFTTLAVVAGHNWPIFLDFKGGKGAAAIFGISLAMVPVLTLVSAGPSLLVMLLLRNVVLGAAFGFILVNTLVWATGQDAEQVTLCVALTLLVTATYLVSVRRHISSSIRTKQWRALFMELSG